MLEQTLKLPAGSGFIALPPQQGRSRVSYVSKSGASNEYSLSEPVKITGLCSYQFMSAAGIVKGVLLTSPQMHTVVTPVTVKVGQCAGPFAPNQTLQQLGLLIYECSDSSVLLIPVDVKSPLLVEVDV